MNPEFLVVAREVASVGASVGASAGIAGAEVTAAVTPEEATGTAVVDNVVVEAVLGRGLEAGGIAELAQAM